MRILIVSNLFPPAHLGGYELACRDTVEILSAAGHDCYVLTSDFRASDASLNDDGMAYPIERVMRLHHNWGANYDVSRFEIAQKLNFDALAQTIEKTRPDVVYFWNLYGLGWHLLRALLQEGAPPATFHFMDWSVLAYQRTFRTIVSSFRGTPAIWGNVRPFVRNAIFISKFMRKQLNIYPVYADVVYPFVRPDGLLHKAEYHLRQTVKAVFVGQIEDHKGISFLCETIDKYRRQRRVDLKLDVYGLSPAGQDDRLRKRYGDFVSVIANLDRLSLLQRLATYDLGFFPSLWEEPFGIAQIEMMQAGLPVISTGRGGSGEVFNGRNLLLYRYDDQEALTQTLDRLLSNYEKIAHGLGAEARDYVLTNHGVGPYRLTLEKHLRTVAA